MIQMLLNCQKRVKEKMMTVQALSRAGVKENGNESRRQARSDAPDREKREVNDGAGLTHFSMWRLRFVV